MSTQVSRKAIELRVKWLNEALGRPVEPWTETDNGCKGNAGNFHIDHYSGGYRIEEQLVGGGSHPTFGQQRMSKGQLCNFLDAILTALEITKPALAACREVVEWARTPGNHGGNPHRHSFVKSAQDAINKAAVKIP